MPDAPLGLVDSGVGGLTVARAMLDQMPHERLHYVGDTANGPYGPRPLAEVRRLALGVMDDLVDDGVKLLVIACNTASAACLRDARERYDVPVVEVVLPAARRAVQVTRTGRVGVLATQATVASQAYDDAFAVAPHVTLTSMAAPGLVEMVERGETTGPRLERLAGEHLAPLLEAGCDTVVLGCTHYPLLAGVLSYLAGPGVTFVSSATETALDVYRLLAGRDAFRDPALPPPVHDVRATGGPEPFARLARRFLGPEASEVVPDAVGPPAGVPAAGGA